MKIIDGCGHSPAVEYGAETNTYIYEWTRDITARQVSSISAAGALDLTFYRPREGRYRGNRSQLMGQSSEITMLEHMRNHQNTLVPYSIRAEVWVRAQAGSGKSDNVVGSEGERRA